MLRLRSLFSDPPVEEAASYRQSKFVQGSFLVYTSIPQTQSFGSITAEISELISETLNENRQIHNLVLAIDLISTANAVSRGESKQLAGELLEFIDRQFLNIRERFVGITDDESKLPLQGLLITGALALEEIDNVHLFVME